jgi:aminoglycoside phosphotransferase (APT) family kinase protein
MTSKMNIAEALSGHSKLEGIQWMLRSAPSRRALRDQLKVLLSGPNTLGPCRLRHAKIKRSGRKLRANYDAFVRVEGTEKYSARPIAVMWALDGEGDRRQGKDEMAEMQAEVLRRGVAAPFAQLMAELPEWRMHLQVSPLDARFTQLARLSDPRYVRDMLAAAHAASGLASDRPRPDGYAVTSMRYAPGERHVLRYDPLGADKGGTVFAKLYAGEQGAHASHVTRKVADWLAEHGEGVTAVRPLAYVAEDGVVLYPRVLGAPLSEHLRRRLSQDLGRFLERAGAAVRTLHHLPQAVVGSLQPHDFTAELSKAARASKHIPRLLPSVGEAIRALLERARELHERLPQEPPTFTHGDLKSEHLWATQSGPTLIDFDTCCLADPAFDVGRFLADLQLWFAAYDRKGLEQAQAQFLAGYAPAMPVERLVRARLYEAVQLVKIARRIPLFNHDWAARTGQLIRRAQAVMKALELNFGSRATQASSRGFREQHHTSGERRRQSSERGARS